jgi:hypothetical protein
MKSLVLILSFFSVSAFAQMSVQESDSNRLSIMGRTVNFNFFQLANTETDKFNDDGGRISTYNMLTASTWVSANYRLALRIPYQYNTAGTDRFNGSKVNENEGFLQDIIIGMQNYNLLYLPWDFELYWEGRAYLPTSPNSKKTGMISRFRNDFILSKVFSKHWETEYVQKASYYWQSKSAYRNNFTDEDGFDVSVVSTTKHTELEHWVAAWYKITPEIGVSWRLGETQTSWNGSDEEDRPDRSEKVRITGPQIRFPITKNANFIFSYTDEVKHGVNEEELGQFQADNTEFTLLSFVRF